jgi:hypothetical protein
MSQITSAPETSSPESALIRVFASLPADLAADTAVRLVIQITELSVDHKDLSDTYRDLEYELKLLHQTLILTGLAIREYNDRLLGESLANTIKPEMERCCMALLELLDKVNCTRQGLAFTSISDLWRPIFGSRWDGSELSSLKMQLGHIRRSLGGFLMALNSCALF